MRIYNTDGPNPQADDVFYKLVKPVHEKYGARFIGRYLDKKGRHVVLWEYPSEAEMDNIQQQVAVDAETIKNREIRLHHGLHGVTFEEYLLFSTER